MENQFRIILTRHSQAIHNELKSEIQSHTQKKQAYKKSSQYLSFKHNPNFIDREEINPQEINSISQILDKNKIGLVIVSPLARCIQTALQLQLPQNVQIIVQPLITSRIISAWSIGKSLKSKKEQFKNYKNINFNHCQNQNTHWNIDILLKDQSDFKSFYQSHQTSTIQYERLILQYVKNGKGQTYKSIIKRAIAFKQKLNNVYLKKTNKNVLIISHQNFLKVLLAKNIDKKGKARSDAEFQHMNLLYCKKQYLIDSKILQKQENQNQTDNQ